MNKCECGRLVSSHSIGCRDRDDRSSCDICKRIIEIVKLESALCDLLKYPNNRTVVEIAMDLMSEKNRSRIKEINKGA